MQTSKDNPTNHPNLLQLTSLHPAEFMGLLSTFDPICRHYFQYHDLEGHLRGIPKFQDDARCSLPGSAQKLLFILTYLKENPRQHYHGQLFGMQQSRVSNRVAGRWIKVLLPLLEEALRRLKAVPKRFGYALYAFLKTFTRYVLLMDATERHIPRSVYYQRQKHEYSGKKKTHTVKNNLIVDQQDQILFLSGTYLGSIHNKR